ncbi:type I glutamate--ammonia ligase [Candidatus Deianiraea vastatrix]|uniref:Glutamine synthetase/gamma-glutamylputrescine synthetase n=1 Tax=Candidatus Deianiraea vastatrix TaxID=2163644 RepID=A0A5B8XCQ8_9RICK|nr:hypothetical protein [Candidatus Deianiraea vastatrix]QED22836.1 Putative glutamine synthetase/gamma-glutamylputrescine synthetase [Candidatus Deianiraea vastatrix]
MDYTKERNNLIDVWNISSSSLLTTLDIPEIFFQTGIEFEFYLVQKSDFALNPSEIKKPLPKEFQNYRKFSYKDDEIREFSSKIKDKMKEFDVNITDVESEDGKNQFEITFEKIPHVVACADGIVRFKKYACEIAESLGFYFITKAKPFAHDAGNSMHVNISLYNDKYSNIFQHFGNFSPLIKNAIGGIMENAKALVYLSAGDDENSYFRFTRPIFGQMHRNYPTNFSWGMNNRTCMIRLPYSKIMNMQDARIEFRMPCPDSNPYKLFCGLVYAITYGICNNLEPSEPIYGDAFDRKYDDLLEIIPKNLEDAKKMYIGSKVSSIIQGFIGDINKVLYIK